MARARRIIVVLLLLIMNDWAATNVPAQQQSEQLLVEWQLEKQLLELTNEYRRRSGKEIETLVWDDALAEIAREHSQEMALQGFVSHVLPSGNASIRMMRAGYTHASARENIAKSRSFSWASRAFLTSTTHMENIIADDVTSIGIGIVRSLDQCNCPNTLYITVLFANPAQSNPTKTANASSGS
jgi:uncharacterized protein YkwD